MEKLMMMMNLTLKEKLKMMTLNLRMIITVVSFWREQQKIKKK